MSELKYKVGDKVRIKDIGWYNKYKDEDGDVLCGEFAFLEGMKKFCSETLTILEDVDDGYLMLEDDLGYVWTDEMFERLVERNGKTYPYKIGDRVVLKGNNRCATITDLKYNSWGNLSYYVKIDNDKDISIDYPTDLLLPYDDMVEGLMEEETKPKYEDEMNGEYYSTTKYLVRPSGYQFVDENDNVINAQKIVLEKKKKWYPKSYYECCRVLNYEPDEYDKDEILIFGYMADELRSLQKLLVCRNAYWKLYGDEMGLGKPWEYDCKSDYFAFAIIYRNGWIQKVGIQHKNAILAFPTAEMRDAFYENFKSDIEQCKELL